MKQKKKILVIIVTYNAMRWIDRCITSLLSSTLSNDIYIVDNGSNDGTRDYIKKTYPSILIYESVQNLGFGKANNIGLIYALKSSYDYVYLLNQDAWVMADTFEKLVNASLEYPDYGILSPMQLQANACHFDSNFGWNIANCNNEEKLCERLYFRNKIGVYDAPRVMAAHWMLTKECILAVGGFSPSFPHYGEDDNYAERAIHKGFKIGVVLEAEAIHDREQRTLTSKQIIYLSYIRMIIIYSGWNNNYLKELILYFFRCIKHVVKYKSFYPIKCLFTFISNIKEFRNNKVLSEFKTAFLEN